MQYRLSFLWIEKNISGIIIVDIPAWSKVVRTMEQTLSNAVDVIVRDFSPDKIILFGSQATGAANQDSDYDLCVLKSGLNHKRKMAQQIYKALLAVGLPVDIIVETPENFSTLETNPFLVYSKIAENGEVLYDKQ